MTAPTVDSIFDTKAFIGNRPAAISTILRRVENGQGGYGCFCNAHLFVAADRSEDVRRALSAAWAIFPDGAPVAWLLRRRGHSTATRISGPDIMDDLMAAGLESGLRHYFFGSTWDGLVRLRSAVEKRHSGIQIAGQAAPPMGSLDRIEGAVSPRAIAACAPDIVWCALGAPKQELWMHRNAHHLGHAMVLGVGAAFDFLSEKRARAPLWMQNHGLEWLHRAASEPGRLVPRYVSTNTMFAYYLLRGSYLTGSNGTRER